MNRVLDLLVSRSHKKEIGMNQIHFKKNIFFHLYVVVILLLITFPIKADRVHISDSDKETFIFSEGNNCRTDFDNDRTFLTFYGDSLGDYVDHPWYGAVGWEGYLSWHKPNIRWDIQ